MASETPGSVKDLENNVRGGGMAYASPPRGEDCFESRVVYTVSLDSVYIRFFDVTGDEYSASGHTEEFLLGITSLTFEADTDSSASAGGVLV